MPASVRRALISLSDKQGLIPFAQGLVRFGFELLSTGGTRKSLEAAGVPVIDVAQYTGFPEMMDGRVKTLHPKVHGGLLGRPDLAADAKSMSEHGITPFELVIVNLYPFVETSSKPGVSPAEAIEQIDIGGPSMLRSAAKNHKYVGVVTSPSQYDRVLSELARGHLSNEFRVELAAAAFEMTARYDRAIADYMQTLVATTDPSHVSHSSAQSNEAFPPKLTLSFERRSSLRYGDATADHLCDPGHFIESIIAPSYAPSAFQKLTTLPKWKANVRLLKCPGMLDARPISQEFRRVTGGLLVQDRDEATDHNSEWKVVTSRQPTDSERADLEFAWLVCKHVKSNAILFAKGGQVVGVGAGQMSRLDSSFIAAFKSNDRAKGGVCASDAFFPFRDGIDQIHKAGIAAVIQPGGSKRDDEVIAACNDYGIAMIFTGQRHFRH